MKKTIFTFLTLFVLTTLLWATNVNSNPKGEDVSNDPVTEIVIFKVSDAEAGIKAARAIVEDAKAYNNAIISAEIYQSVSEQNMLTQRILWNSLEEAKAAFAASEQFPNMGTMMDLTTEQVFFDHFYLKQD